jgi:DNA-binding MarR family transcriptional regulator
MDAFGVTLREGWVLMAIGEKPLKQSLVADCLNMNANVMVGIVDHLEHLGLAQRHRNPENRREYVLAVTSKGRDVLRRFDETWASRTAEIFRPINEKALAALDECARAIIDSYYDEITLK